MKSVFDPCRLAGRLFYLLVSLLLAAGVARAVPPAMTTINDIVYRADGSTASGTLLIVWPQFNTSDNKTVAAGTLSVNIAAGGAVNIALAPNAGATPAGTYYRVTFKLDDGTSSTEYWTVPATSPTTITAIRSTVVPATMAVQVVSRNYVDTGLALKATDNAVVHKAGDTMTGALTLNGDPSASLQAATKSYVDAHAGGGGSTPGQFVVDGSTYPNIHAAVVAAGTNGSVLIPANYAGTDTDSNPNKVQIIDQRGKPNRQRGFINMLTDCGLKGDGLTDDSAAAQACFDAYPGFGFMFPQTQNNLSCSYFFGTRLVPKGDGVAVFGSSSGFRNFGTNTGGTMLCFAAAVGGFLLDLANTTGASIHDLSLQGSEGTTFLTDSTLINFPSGASLLQFNRSIASIQRTGNTLSVTITAVGGQEGLFQSVGSTVKISGVTGDTTMNGLCVIATLTNKNGFGENPQGFTCAQNGADSGPFGAVGTAGLPTTGASTADGIRVCGNFFTIYRVSVKAFGRHGINADAQSGHGCSFPFADDLIVRDSILINNQGDGVYCQGTDCNVGLFEGNSIYYNMLWGAEDNSGLGNTWIGNNFSNNGAAWVGSGGVTPATKAISSISRTISGGDSTVTVALSAADTKVKLGSCIVIAGVTDSSFNTPAGQCYFVTSFTDSTHFQYIQPGAPANASSSGGTSRMSKFNEAFLAAGVDSGAHKIATQSPSSSAIVLYNYVEGGQPCKLNSYVISIGSSTGGCNSTQSTWIPSFMNVQGSGGGGMAGTLTSNLGMLANSRDLDHTIYLRAGIPSTARNVKLYWTKYDNSVGWIVDGGTAGTNGDSSSWIVQRNGGPRRLSLFGSATGSGITRLSSESTGDVQINGDSSSGTGGLSVYSGGASPASVATINSSGIGTFNGGVIGSSLRSQTANVAAAGAVRLAKSDTLAFRNNANTADVTALSLNASDQAVLPTVASLTSAGNVTAPAFNSNSANPASAGTLRLAQADGVKFRNNANTADLTALAEATDVLQVGEVTNGINVPGPANFANLNATGTITGGSIATGGDSFAGTPRIAWGSFLPGALSSTWTAAQFTPKKAINVVQIDLRAKAGPAGCTTFPVVQITDGTTPINVTLNAAGVSQSVAGGQNYAANSTVQVKVSTAGAGCTAAASDVNVTVQYKMQ